MDKITPVVLKDAPALIQAVFPAQKVSFEAQSERKAVAAQTLTGLGSYWKGRKPLILVRAIVLGSLLPQTGDREKDLEIFEVSVSVLVIRPSPKCSLFRTTRTMDRTVGHGSPMCSPRASADKMAICRCSIRPWSASGGAYHSLTGKIGSLKRPAFNLKHHSCLRSGALKAVMISSLRTR